jgi:outer membrane receptor for ferrienterochelin and colicins
MTHLSKLKPFLPNVLLLAALLLSFTSKSQTSTILGQTLSENEPVAYAQIFLEGKSSGAIADANGQYILKNITPGTYILKVSATGYLTQTIELKIESGKTYEQDIILKKDILNLSQIVVSGSRKRVERYNSPVIVNTVNANTLDFTQSLNVAEGLNFSPGLRVENNCQNCGFTQLRMNGLDGPYSQVLINSRPVFSALAGVYGLEMLPSSMVDQIEVVRGGGSVMFGGNGIAGTVNIITKDPIQNNFEVGINQALINGEASDRTINFNGSIVSEDLNKGITFFGFNRNREHWDANGDGFSEIVRLQATTFGFDAFYKLSDRTKFKLGSYFISEFRRGGNKFELFPHQTDVTEQLDHNILNANISLEHESKDNRHKLTVYGSMQTVNRASYYGGGGRVVAEGDSLTADDILAINAYGNSQDISTVTGLQYTFNINSKLNINTGSEYIYNNVLDEMPGYGRVIDQQVGTWGSFAELEYKPFEKLSLLAGGRYDLLRISGVYNLEDNNFTNKQSLNAFVPRVTAMYKLKPNLKLRASFAQGYRGPQAFDEDLHIETVGGAARFVQLGPNLEVERSNSAVLSLNYDQFVGKYQMNFVVEGFYTQLTNPFIFSDQEELPNGVAVITKRNGDGAVVSGTNLEANIAFSNKLVLQSGATVQTALYDIEEVLWAPEDPSENIPVTATKRLLRTPNAYGFFSLAYNPLEVLTLSYSGVITGSMDVAHVTNIETEFTEIKQTPTFFENTMKLAYTLQKDEEYRVEFFGGIQNFTNSFQNDFDTGAERDAGYIYGPLRPRTFFVGLKFGLD